MQTMQNVIDNIAARGKSRNNLKLYIKEYAGTERKYAGTERKDLAGIESSYMLCEILDDLLLQKLQADKVLEGILKDIQGNITRISEDVLAG